MDLKKTYNQIAEDWFQEHKVVDWWQKGVDKFISYFRPDSYILDVGCGPGIASKYLVGKGFKVLGIDISEKMIEIARREAAEANFSVMDIKEIDRLRESFDGILAKAVFLHIPKKEITGIFRKLKSKLKAGGYFYVAVKEIKPGGPDEEIKKENDYGYRYERFFSYFTLEEIRSYFSGLEMRIVYESVTLSGNTRWIQVIAQK